MIELQDHRFTCSACGSHHFKKIGYNGVPLDANNFYSGQFMCEHCGTSLSRDLDFWTGKRSVLCYYSSEFYKISKPIQLHFDFV